MGTPVDIVDDVRGRLRIRLLGIDTPETKKPGYTVGCWGPQATEFAKSTLLGQRVAFVTDPSQGMYDRFGRTLAYLDKADGWDYSIEAARAGAAHSSVYHRHPSAGPARSPLPNRKRRPRAGACGDRRASPKRGQSTLIRRGAPPPTVSLCEGAALS
jgi:endonuclease YncB( thermonuclease family)